jgi:hypothetical protein
MRYTYDGSRGQSIETEVRRTTGGGKKRTESKKEMKAEA